HCPHLDRVPRAEHDRVREVVEVVEVALVAGVRRWTVLDGAGRELRGRCARVAFNRCRVRVMVTLLLPAAARRVLPVGSSSYGHSTLIRARWPQRVSRATFH